MNYKLGNIRLASYSIISVAYICDVCICEGDSALSASCGGGGGG